MIRPAVTGLHDVPAILIAFVMMAAIGHLEIVLGVFTAGAFTFFLVLFTQLVRNREAIARAASLDVAS